MFHIRKIQTMAFAAAALCTIVSAGLAQTTLPPNISYNAVGKFATPPASGNDLLELAGQPFHLSVEISEATPPFVTNPPCSSKCVYKNVPVVGAVASGIVSGLPIPLSPGTLGTLTLTVGGTGKPDVMLLVFPQTVVGEALTITATIYLPHGTITVANGITPFKSTVQLTPMTGSLVYANSTASTTLDYASPGSTLVTKLN